MTHDEARAWVDSWDAFGGFHSWNIYCEYGDRCVRGVIGNEHGFWPCVCNMGWPDYEREQNEKHFQRKEQEHLSHDKGGNGHGHKRSNSFRS